MFFFTIPAICFALSTFFALRAPISTDTHREIRHELARRAQGHHELYDPVSKQVIHDDNRSDKETEMLNIVQSFSHAEQQLVQEDDGIRKLQCRLIINLALTVGGMVGFNVLMKMLPLPKIFNQIALFASTLIVLLLVWQILKLATLVQSAEKLKAFANAQRFDKTHGSFSFRSHDKRGRSVTSQYTSPAAPAVLATTSEFAHMGDKAVQEISFRLYAWLDRTRSARDGLTASRSRAPRTQFVIMEASNAAVEEAGSSSDMPPSKLPDKSPDKSPDASGASSPNGSFRPRRSSFTTDDVDTVRASFRPRRLRQDSGQSDVDAPAVTQTVHYFTPPLSDWYDRRNSL